MYPTDFVRVMVPAYDNPTLWEGHSSMIQEVKSRLRQEPDAILCSVGGGRLLGGIIIGCKNVGWDHRIYHGFFHANKVTHTVAVPIVALKTIGSDCFYISISLNNGRVDREKEVLPPGVNLVYDEKHSVHLAHFTSFSSKASGSLGESEPAASVVRMALERMGSRQQVSPMN
jgi:L-serine/L-threonine ammonia-lyase